MRIPVTEIGHGLQTIVKNLFCDLNFKKTYRLPHDAIRDRM